MYINCVFITRKRIVYTCFLGRKEKERSKETTENIMIMKKRGHDCLERVMTVKITSTSREGSEASGDSQRDY